LLRLVVALWMSGRIGRGMNLTGHCVRAAAPSARDTGKYKVIAPAERRKKRAKPWLRASGMFKRGLDD